MTVFNDEYYVSEDGLRLHYRDYPGSAARPPVLCLPGLTRNCRDFHAIAAHLSPRFRVIALDFRGRGLSDYDRHWQKYQPTTYVQDVVTLLGELDVDDVVCLGTSLGGLVATILAGAHPERVNRVIFNDVGAEVAPEGVGRIMGYVGLAPPVTSWEEAAQQAKATYGSALPDLSDEDWLAFARLGYREDQSGVPRLDHDPRLREALREPGSALGDPWALFTALQDIPLLVLHGVLSDILTDDIIARMRAVKPDLQLVQVPNRGHAPLLNEVECLAGIDVFLADLG
jgi:pimeloyl-ACP methyl ester carboxylesterase